MITHNSKFNIALLGVVLLTGNLYAQGQGNGPPTAIITGHGQEIQLPTPSLNEDGTWELNLSRPIDIFGPGGQLEARITSLGAFFDPDPFIAYGVAVIDFGAPSSFGFTFITPIVPTSSPGTASASFSASVTDGSNGGPGVNFTALPPGPGIPTDGGPPEAQVFNLINGVITNPGLDLGPSIANIPLSGGSGTVGPFADSGPLPAGTWTSLRIDLNFQGSGGGDIYTLNGRGEILQASVPDAGSSLALMLLGCSALGLYYRGSVRRK